MAIITIDIDSSGLFFIIASVIAIATYVGILEYRFRRLEGHPFLKGLRQLQDEQLLDLARAMINRRDNNVQ